MRISSTSKSKAVVVHSTANWLPQTQTWLYNQVRYLPDEVETHIVCEVTENLDQFWLPNIHGLSETARWRYFRDRALRKLQLREHAHFGLLVEQARRHQAQLLHSHFGNLGWVNLETAKRAELKHVVTFYGFDVDYLPKQYPRWRKRYQSLFEQVDRVLCEGPFMAQSIVNLGCPEHKVRVHHLGVRVDEIAFEPRVWSPDQPLRVLIAAAFREKKGIPYALEALGRVQEEVSLEITIIGDADSSTQNQAERRKILEVIERYDLQPKVRLLGYQPHAIMFEEAYKHHVFLSPSITASYGDTEGGAPVSIIEMAASGMPIISTRHCDIPAVVEDGVTGLLAEERDIEGLVSRLRWLVEQPQQWGSMLEAARKHIVADYNTKNQGLRLGQIYSHILY